MSVFSMWLRGEMQSRGYVHPDGDIDKKRFGDDLGIRAETTIANWLDDKTLPNMRGIVLLAKFLGYSTEYVMEQAGYEIVPSKSESQRNERSAQILASIPEFAAILKKIAAKPARERDVWISVIEKLLRDEPPSSSGESGGSSKD